MQVIQVRTEVSPSSIGFRCQFIKPRLLNLQNVPQTHSIFVAWERAWLNFKSALWITVWNGSMGRYRVPDTQSIHWVSGPVFFLNRTFSAAWNIRYPDTSLKRGVSRPLNVLIFLDLPRITERRWWTLQFLPFNFTKIPRYGLCYPNFYSKRSRHVKILFCRMRWNSTIREVSSVFTSPKFHGTWNTRDSNTTGIPRFMKLPMLKSWQNSLIRENCNTFIVLNSTILSISMHDIEKSDTAFLLHWYLTSVYDLLSAMGASWPCKFH